MSKPYDPNETAEQVKAALRRNHPELSDKQLDALLTGQPTRSRQGKNQAKSGWTVGTRGASGGPGIVGGRTARRGKRVRLNHKDNQQ